MDKVLFCGGRNFQDIRLVELLFERLPKNFIVIHGGAKGADSLVDATARRHGLIIEVYKADWNKYGKSAGPVRNYEMLAQQPKYVCAFDGGTGTAHMISIALQKQITVYKICSSNDKLKIQKVI
jgi:hypothetical protein